MFRVFVEGTARDYEAHAQLADRAGTFVEEHEPGMLAYECYAEETTKRVVWLETYADAQAFLTHVKNMSETGIMEEMGRLLDYERVTALGSIADPQVKAMIDQFGAAELPVLVRFGR